MENGHMCNKLVHYCGLFKMVMSVMFATGMPEFAGGYAIARGIVFTARYLYQGDRSGPGWREDREVSEDVGR